MFEINFYSFSGHAHDEGIDGTVSQSRDNIRSGTWESQADRGWAAWIKELEAGDGGKTQAKDEYYQLREDLKKNLEDKEKEIHQDKEVTMLEYRDSDAFLSELGVSYTDGFDDALR